MSTSAPALDRRSLWSLVALASAAFLLTSLIVDGPPWSSGIQLSDTGIYELYGEATLEGFVPYRDFTIEYPPGALVAFVPPAAVSDAAPSYDGAFGWMMRGCGIAIVVLVGAGLAAIGASRRHALVSLSLVAISPLLLGRLMLQRFDLLPAAVLAAGVLALLHKRDRIALGLLALAVVTKGYAIVALPLFLGSVWRRSTRRELLLCFIVFATVLLIVIVPFLIVGPEGMRWALREQTSRPLNRETTAGGALMALHQVTGLRLRSVVSHGSGNFAGSLPDALASISVLVQVAFLAWLWIRCLRSRMTDDILLVGVAAAVLAFMVFGKVLSPQYLIWLLPIVPLVRDQVAACAGLLAVGLALTQAYFPRRYFDIGLLDGTVSWIIVTRNLLLIALLVLVTRSLVRRTPALA